MTEITLSKEQTSKFWKESCDAVEWDMMSLDKYLYDKYTITKRVWQRDACLTLTLNNEQFKTYLLLYL